MIRAMRENLKVLSVSLWIVIAAFIASLFFVFGRDTLTGGSANSALTVNGEDIPLADYQQLYRAYMEFYQQTFKERLTDELVRQLRLPERVVDDLIQERLLLQWARREGLAVGDQELRAQIEAMPAFQEGDRFSRERYLQLLAARRLNPVTFETAKRSELLRLKVEAVIVDGVKLSDAEMREAWLLTNERIRVQYLLIETAPLIAAIQVADAELQKYYDAQQTQFRRPEQRRVQYVIVSPKGLEAEVSVTAEDVETYYRDHAREFEQPKRIRVAHILIRVASTGGGEAEATARQKAEATLQRIKAGADFAQVAKEISEDAASAAVGGDLGFVTEGELLKGFETAAFALKKGEVSQPVRTEFGYHLIKLLDAQAPEKKSLKEVQATIRTRLLTERADRLAQSRAETLHRALSAAQNLRGEAERQGALVRESGLLTRGAPLEGIGQVRDLEETVWGLPVGGTTVPIKTPSGYVIGRVSERKEAHTPPLAEIREAVVTAVKQEKAQAQAIERAKTIAPAFEKGENVTVLARRENLKLGEIGPFSRATPLADRELAQELGPHPFALRTGTVSAPVTGRRGVYLVKVIERQPPDSKGFEAARPEIGRQLLAEKRTQAWQSWLRALRAQARIDINQKVLGPLGQ